MTVQLSRELRFRTDFNQRRNRRGILTAVVGFDGSANPPERGDIVRLFDGDGNTCLAVVDRYDDELVYAKPDWNTWRTEVRFQETDLMEALKLSVEAARSRKAAIARNPETQSFEPEFFELKVG